MQVTKENWLPIAGYEGKYEISDWGRVKSLTRISTDKKKRIESIPERIRVAPLNKKGYPVIQLSKNGKPQGWMVHRLVALHFIPNPTDESCTQINHINGIKADNRPSNLEWCNNSENQIHRHRVLGQRAAHKGLYNQLKFLPRAVIKMDMDENELETFPSIAEAGRQGYVNIGKYLSGERKTASGFKWKYA